MPRTVFTKRFAPHSEGRKLQQQINELEEGIDMMQGVSLSLEIGGLQVRIMNYSNEPETICVSDDQLNMFVASGIDSAIRDSTVYLAAFRIHYERLISEL